MKSIRISNRYWFHWIGFLIGEFRWWILIGQVAICGLFIGRNCIQLLSFSILSKPEGRESSWTVNSWIEFPLDLSPRAFTFGILNSFMVFIICIYQTDFEFKFRILVFEHFLNVHECISCTGILIDYSRMQFWSLLEMKMHPCWKNENFEGNRPFSEP